MVALRETQLFVQIRVLPRRGVRETVGAMHYADWAEYPKYPIGGLLYGHAQTPTPAVAGMHYDWVRPRPKPIGGMYYGRAEP